MSKNASNNTGGGKQTGVIAACLLVVASLGAAFAFPDERGWCAVMILLGGFMIALGWIITGRPLGVLINEQNVVSLSRFQTALWTLLLLSAFLVVAVKRIEASWTHPPSRPEDDPLHIEVDERLWALLGISLTSLAGSSLVAGVKKTDAPDAKDVQKTAATLLKTNNFPDSLRPLVDAAPAAPAAPAAAPAGAGAGAVVPPAVVPPPAAAAAPPPKTKTEEVVASIDSNRQGLLYANPTPKDAQFSDMFEGDEVGNTAHLDLGKVQMFYFTVIVALAYGAEVYNALQIASQNGAPLIHSLPTLSPNMVALLGISNAGYLANKGTNHTQKAT